MLTRTQITLIVIAVVIIILFAITYFILFRMAFISRIKLVKYGHEDDKVIKILSKNYKRYIKKNDPEGFVNKYLNRDNHNTLYTVLVNVLISIITLICVFFIGIGLYFRLNDQQMFVNGKTLLVVETGSMSEKHSKNKYLVENNLNNQIKARSLIVIDRTLDYKLYDICAFKMEDKIIVHRIIEIKYDEKTNEKLYRFRGDANEYSLPGEFEVKEEQIIGEYCCLNSVFLGTSILFLQSGIGMISILVSLIIYVLYTAYYDKDTRAFEERCDEVLQLFYRRLHKDKPQYTVYDTELIIPRPTLTTQEETIIEKEEPLLEVPTEDSCEVLETITEIIEETPTVEENLEVVAEVEPEVNEPLTLDKTDDVLESYEQDLTNAIEELPVVLETPIEESIVHDIIDFEEPITNDVVPTINENEVIAELEAVINPFEGIVSLSYPDKMMKNEEYVRSYYNELKSYILSYEGITNRISNQYETFKLGYNKLFLLEIRGTKLKLNINVPVGYLDEKYHLKENTTKKLINYPVGLRITSDRAMKYAKEIVDTVLKDYELTFNIEYKDYMTMLMLEFDKNLTKRYSLFARLSLADDDVRRVYNDLKNLVMSYKGIHSRLSFKGDSFTDKYKKLFMIELRGETLRLHIADNIENYDPKYHMRSNGHSRANDYPGYLKVKSDRSLRYAKEIIKSFLEPLGYEYEESSQDYLEDYPRMSEIDLVTSGEIKLRRDKFER